MKQSALAISLFIALGGSAFAAAAQAEVVVLEDTPAVAPSQQRLGLAASSGPYQAIGVGVSSTNRLFVSFPKLGGPYRYGLTEVVGGSELPYPDASWNAATARDDHHFASVQDLYVDADDFLWVLDSQPATQNPDGSSTEGYFKLVKFDIATGRALRIYHFDDLDKHRSALNDVRVDTQRNLAYLSDPGLAAIVVLDLSNGKSRVVLANTTPTLADPDIVLSYGGVEMRDATGKPYASNVNGIALTRDNRFLYFKPVTNVNLYRIETQYLADPNLDAGTLLSKVQFVKEVGITHGLEADSSGNIILTSSLDYSIKYLSPDFTVHTLVTDSRLIWPDSLGIGTNGYLYVSSSQLNRGAQWNNGVSRATLPYGVYRTRLPH
ncbi:MULTISPECIES: L-dopachrome tautomerase-related protein [unclassified Burkholderia]|uniref:L-dopachrome tautomerase-related protein n=1 Tax=unclassified Burkholderia TaxID=2613784 RepID=UPI001422002A|nr:MULTISPECIES: L-dopachrome tautomerase-related protein [unclassified Burkholderia]NIE85284.1 gluconolactonase [Burkholderia sp. Tr-860]NIF63208.1 gluconolactonase [Burkholderia sp. Cy-647]NIF72296.1 gluconolactonase [Burkholderia sp. Ap-962]NIF87158.1 gluconolactonase [Burkholderia sp. Cy-637]NIF95472.1 gluconolactonase [Burkholderia sp. Ax-1720]